MKKTASYNGTQAVMRTIQLLKLFDDDNPDRELAALTEASGLNKSTVFRLLSALEAEGLVARSERGYRLGPEMIVLGGRAMRANNLRRLSRKHLEKLSYKTGESCTLEVLHLDENEKLCCLVIDEAIGRHLVGISQYIGSRLPVHATSTGKVLLAYGGRELVGSLASADLTGFTKNTFCSREGLEAELRGILDCGYGLARGELEPGLMTAAAPVFDTSETVQAAVSVVAPSTRVGEKELKRLATEAVKTARGISFELGAASNTGFEELSADKKGV